MDIVSQFQSAAVLAIVCSLILLVPSLVVGLLVSIFQAATQIQDYTLSFLPKMIAVGVALYVSGNWMGGQFYQFTDSLFASFEQIQQTPF